MKTLTRFLPRAALATAVALAALPAMALEPFKADYQASYMGMKADGVMTLAPKPATSGATASRSRTSWPT
jgi:hypothetical protein